MQHKDFFKLVSYSGARPGEHYVEVQVSTDHRGPVYAVFYCGPDGYTIPLETQRGGLREFRSLDTLYRTLCAERCETFRLNLAPAQSSIVFDA